MHHGVVDEPITSVEASSHDTRNNANGNKPITDDTHDIIIKHEPFKIDTQDNGSDSKSLVYDIQGSAAVY